jgi:GT2 family glycosyltransferase
MKGDVHIEIGAGQSRQWPEAVQVDLRPAPGIDVVADATCLPFVSKVARGVYCSHLLEHLSYADGLLFLRESYRIMKKGSRLEISCPDLSALCRIYVLTQDLEHRIGDVDRLASTFYGNQDHLADFHRSGYDYDLLSHLLAKTEFSRITRLPSAERINNLKVKRSRELYELRVEAFKPIRRAGKPRISTETQGLKWGSEIEYLKAELASRNVLIDRLSRPFSDPLSALLQLYVMRSDLQQAFPEVRIGDYGRLIGWAKNTVGNRADRDHRRLMRYAGWYRSSPWDELVRARHAASRSEEENKALADHVRALMSEKEEVEQGIGWQLILLYRKLLAKYFPPATIRRMALETTITRLGALSRRTKHMHIRPGLSRESFMRASLDNQYQIFLEHDVLDGKKARQLKLMISKMRTRPLISLVMPTYNSPDEWLKRAIESVRDQIYENWELCIVDDGSVGTAVAETINRHRALDTRIKTAFLTRRSGIASASNEAINLATGEFVGFLDHDDELSQDALYEVVKCINEHSDAELIYTDEDKIRPDGKRIQPFFKPDWSPDLLLSMNYVPHFIVYKRCILKELGGFRLGFEGSQDYDLALRAVERTDRIYHVSKPVYGWRVTSTSTALSLSAKPTAREATRRALAQALERRGIHGEVLDSYNQWYRVRYIPNGDSLVSIIIVTHDNPDLLKTCLGSVQKRTEYRNFEIVIVDHDSHKPEVLDYIQSLGCTTIRIERKFNFAEFNNRAAKIAKGRYLLFLNDDTEVIDSNWLGEMAGVLDNRSDVGAVGAKLLYPDDRIQHAGVILGLGGTAGHPFRGMPNSNPGYFGLAHVVHNCSAVTAACMLVRRDIFEALNGFDENLKLGGNDVDLCVRMRKAGYRIVYNPHAVLYHREGATRKGPFPPSDYNYFVSKLKDDIRNGDPYYHKCLSTQSEETCYLINPRLVGL